MQSDDVSLITQVTHLENMASIFSNELKDSLIKLHPPLCLFYMFRKNSGESLTT